MTNEEAIAVLQESLVHGADNSYPFDAALALAIAALRSRDTARLDVLEYSRYDHWPEGTEGGNRISSWTVRGEFTTAREALDNLIAAMETS